MIGIGFTIVYLILQNLPTYTVPKKEKHESNLKNLNLVKEYRGLALPDLCSYIYAAQIKHLLMWMTETANPKVKGIEMELVKSLSSIIK